MWKEILGRLDKQKPLYIISIELKNKIETEYQHQE